jgi:hypothetical protein
LNPNYGQTQQQTPGTGPLNPNYGQQQTSGMYPTQGRTTGSTNPVNPQQDFNYGNTTPHYGADPPIYLQQVQRTVGIVDVPNGRGTGFFVTRDGLIATTRYVVGGEQHLHIELMDKRVIRGQVVRSFPEFDLALILTNIHLDHLLTVVQTPNLPDNAQLIAVTHSGQGLRSTKRSTRHQTAPHWFPTLINHLLDAGGNPIFTGGQSQLVGMLSKNASRTSGYLYGLHITKIYQCVDQYMQEKQRIAGQSAYCPACGSLSSAPSFGGYYCEHCGNTLPFALDMTRYPKPQLTSVYGENIHRPCPKCNSQVGFYKGECLRCGYQL